MQIKTYKRRIALFNEMLDEADTPEKIQFLSDAIQKLDKSFTNDYLIKHAQITKLQNELKEFSQPLVLAISALESKLNKMTNNK